jgi:hypothetical protein
VGGDRSTTSQQMKLFKCQHCEQILYFENQTCVRCSRRLGYIPEIATLSALEFQDGAWRALAVTDKLYRPCANSVFDACNWLVEATASDPYCIACRHNRIIPDISILNNLVAWRKIEAAKHRLLYSLLKLRLPLGQSRDGPDARLTFDFLSSPSQSTGPKIMTGHDNGLITLAVEEADDVERERRRSAMHEPYRTLLGHFRHEVGHYFWDRLVRDAGQLDSMRQIFGDDRADYAEALRTYYVRGAPPDWPERFISAYATSHPWEDFAETWAHYLHIVDTLEMAYAFNMSIHPEVERGTSLDAVADFDSYADPDFDRVIDTWMPLSNALNCLNRTMGQSDLYPFLLSPQVIVKLRAIHNLVHTNNSMASEEE